MATRIRTLKQLVELARNRGSVLLAKFHIRRLPAAVVINWQGGMIQRHFDAGMWKYVPRTHKQSKQVYKIEL